MSKGQYNRKKVPVKKVIPKKKEVLEKSYEQDIPIVNSMSNGMTGAVQIKYPAACEVLSPDFLLVYAQELQSLTDQIERNNQTVEHLYKRKCVLKNNPELIKVLYPHSN